MSVANILFNKASITASGAILLGSSVVCDGFEEGRKTAIFTHIHTDHTEAFPTCLGRCDNVYVSKQTYDLLTAMEGEYLSLKNNFHGINYKDSEMPQNEKITLFESSHMLGASQVQVESSDGVKIFYSSDFTSKDSVPTKCDVLVLDSTHGDPRFDSVVDPESVERRFVDMIEDTIKNGKPACIHAHRGRLQYAMHILSRKINPDVSFLSSARDISAARVYDIYGMEIRPLVDYNSYVGKKIANGTYPYLEFRPDLHLTDREEAGMRRFFLMGSPGGGSALIDHGDNSVHLEFDDHANFSSILRYVEKASPEVVIVDNYRTPHGETLAEIITKTLNIPSKGMPQGNSSI